MSRIRIYYRNKSGNPIFPGICNCEMLSSSQSIMPMTEQSAVTLLVSGLVVCWCCCGPEGALLLSVLWPLPALRVLPTLPVLPTLFLSPAVRETEALVQCVIAIITCPWLWHHSGRLHCHASVPLHSREDTIPTGFLLKQQAGWGWG